MPIFHYTHVVGDTTYLVVPRNLSYMWDGDSPGSSDDDSGEQELEYPCNGFIGWRMIDFFVVKQDQTVERPADVYGYPIPLATCGGTGSPTRGPTPSLRLHLGP